MMLTSFKIFFIISIGLMVTTAVAQRNVVSSLYVKRNITDSTATVTTHKLLHNDWELAYSFTNSFVYKNRRLVRAVISDQVYRVVYSRHHIKVTVFDKGKRVGFYDGVYNQSKQVSHANHYTVEKGKKELWGKEHYSYDSIGRLISANYIVLNSKSMHGGYEHNYRYEYDPYGKLLRAFRGYGKTEFFYDDKNALVYSLDEDREFVKQQFKNTYTIIVR